jgi:quercetin dioxygenase-like cupin family protein
MEKFSLEALAREHLQRAATAAARRSASTVYGGHEHRLRQTVVAMLGGLSLAEHANPGEATVMVLSGRIRLHAGPDSWDGRTGDLLIVPQANHSIEAVEDSAILLTVSKR